jgi:hypothetical protein
MLVLNTHWGITIGYAARILSCLNINFTFFSQTRHWKPSYADITSKTVVEEITSPKYKLKFNIY